jgi:hypothetical protein
MLFNPVLDSIADVIAIRQRAIESLKAGASVVSWAVEGTSVNKVIALSPEKVIYECNEYLRYIAPDVYGRRIRRTIPFYIN